MSEEKEFDELHEKIRTLYDELVYKDSNNPMQVFGVFLGIMAQEFQEFSTKENFDAFLTKMMEIPWTKETN